MNPNTYTVIVKNDSELRESVYDFAERCFDMCTGDVPQRNLTVALFKAAIEKEIYDLTTSYEEITLEFNLVNQTATLLSVTGMARYPP